MKYTTLDNLCVARTSSLKLSIISMTEKYKVFGASGFLGYIDCIGCNSEYVGIIKDGAGTGRVALYQKNSSILGTMQYLIPKKNVNSSFLYYAVKSLNLGKNNIVATIPHIYFKDYKNRKLPNFRTDEQVLISKKLNQISLLISTKKTQLVDLENLIKLRFIFQEEILC